MSLQLDIQPLISNTKPCLKTSVRILTVDEGTSLVLYIHVDTFRSNLYIQLERPTSRLYHTVKT